MTGRGRSEELDLDLAYAGDVHRWWHLSRPGPELLQALEDGWIVPDGMVLDVGCGLGTEVSTLAERGSHAVGIDLSLEALRRARTAHVSPRFVQADALALPFKRSVFDVALDRGFFHYLGVSQRTQYAHELRRVVRPGGRMLLRASLYSAGVKNDVDEEGIRRSFAGWRVERLEQSDVPSDTRTLRVLVVRLERGPD